MCREREGGGQTDPAGGCGVWPVCGERGRGPD